MLGIEIKERKLLVLERPKENGMEFGRYFTLEVTFNGDWLDFPTYVLIYFGTFKYATVSLLPFSSNLTLNFCFKGKGNSEMGALPKEMRCEHLLKMHKVKNNLRPNERYLSFSTGQCWILSSQVTMIRNLT